MTLEILQKSGNFTLLRGSLGDVVSINKIHGHKGLPSCVSLTGKKKVSFFVPTAFAVQGFEQDRKVAGIFWDGRLLSQDPSVRINGVTTNRLFRAALLHSGVEPTFFGCPLEAIICLNDEVVVPNYYPGVNFDYRNSGWLLSRNELEQKMTALLEHSAMPTLTTRIADRNHAPIEVTYDAVSLVVLSIIDCSTRKSYETFHSYAVHMSPFSPGFTLTVGEVIPYLFL